MRKIFILALFVFSVLQLSAIEPDTSICKKLVVDFYRWYGEKFKAEDQSEFQPKFIQDKEGYTTLDFESYVYNLRRLNCSENFINREIAHYQPCINNLKTIKFIDFQNNLSDLSDYENIECDFFNYNRWTMSMENFSGVEVLKAVVNKDSVIINGRIYEDTQDHKYYYGDIFVTLLKIDNEWKIENIEI
jgi:hypothetical protein